MMFLDMKWQQGMISWYDVFVLIQPLNRRKDWWAGTQFWSIETREHNYKRHVALCVCCNFENIRDAKTCESPGSTRSCKTIMRPNPPDGLRPDLTGMWPNAWIRLDIVRTSDIQSTITRECLTQIVKEHLYQRFSCSCHVCQECQVMFVHPAFAEFFVKIKCLVYHVLYYSPCLVR